MVRVGSMTYFQDHMWYDELADGKLKDETLVLKAKIEGSWGDTTPRVVKFCKWLKGCFENFHELEYEVLVKLQECLWKVNAHEIALFTHEYITIKESECLNHSKDCLDVYRELLRLIDEGMGLTTRE
ncbi:hypothetical protein Tco_1031956 [Tanacetum coccineum]|uniref:Uncharacterized protein n=1 Tax=Tanacetum coccineum TaxID=301880 RepID=A0ABQ5GB02_9ASTR